MKKLLLLSLLILMACSKGSELDIEEDDTTKVIDSFTKEAPKIRSASLIINGNEIIGSIDQKKKIIYFRTLEWLDNMLAVPISVDSDSELLIEDHLNTNTGFINLTNSLIFITLNSPTDSLESYSIKLEAPQKTGLPVMCINTNDNYNIFNKPKSKEYIDCEIRFDNYIKPEEGFTSMAGVRGRGNSTWGYKKKPMRIKFDEKISFMGLPKEKSWVLLANYLDPTLLMNSAAFELAKRMDLPYTNTDCHIEVFYNGEYLGNYQLTEQVQVKKGRVEVDKNTGYLVELDKYFDDEIKFKTDYFKLPVMVKYPKDSQIDFIQKDFHRLEELMQSRDYEDSDLSTVIDVDSFVKYMLVFELTGNKEIHWPKSVKLYKKDARSLLTAGPVWDFDWAFGKDASQGDFIYFSKKKHSLLFDGDNSSLPGSRFFNKLLKNKKFKQVYKKTWSQYLSQEIFDLSEFLEKRMVLIEKSQELDIHRWSFPYNYSEELAKMNEWLLVHVDYLDKRISDL